MYAVNQPLALLRQLCMLAPASELLDLMQSIADELCCWLVLQSAAGLGHPAKMLLLPSEGACCLCCGLLATAVQENDAVSARQPDHDCTAAFMSAAVHFKLCWASVAAATAASGNAVSSCW
jgi:hypothetical protein